MKINKNETWLQSRQWIPERDLKKDWGLEVRRIRRELHLTQLQLAAISGIRRSQISQIENNKYEHCYNKTLRALARGLGISYLAFRDLLRNKEGE